MQKDAELAAAAAKSTKEFAVATTAAGDAVAEFSRTQSEQHANCNAFTTTLELTARAQIHAAETRRLQSIAELEGVERAHDLRVATDALTRIHDENAEAQNEAAKSAKTYAELVRTATNNLWGFGPTGGFTASNLSLGLAGIGGYFAGDAIFGGQYGGTGGSFGTSAGALYGSTFGPIGTVVGALAGGAIGSLFGGDYEPYPYSLVQVGGGGLPIGDSSNITRSDPDTGASGLIFEAVNTRT